jgi:hypothetical protein
MFGQNQALQHGNTGLPGRFCSAGCNLPRPTLFLLLLLFFLAACRQSPYPPREGESTVLMNPSAPPCWHQICPGQTTKDEAMSILFRIPEVEQDSIVDQHHENAFSFVAWLFMPGVAEVGGRFYHRNQTISDISFITRDILTFGEAIEAFGEPTSVLPFSTCKWLHIALFYPDDGLYLEYFDPRWIPGSRFELMPEKSVNEVIFYDPALFADMIKRPLGVTSRSYEHDDILRMMQPWEGFGEIRDFERCRPRP